ncbi:MAG: TetR/AcrR family transcriptional regulator [Maritimibacter sp.]
MKNKENRKAGWKQDPENVKRDILHAAMKEFARSGLSGAKIDDISAMTSTSKRMIYYYFGDKAGLYVAALEAAYSMVRAGEDQLDLEGKTPLAALGALVAFTFDHHRQNPDFIRMVMIENVHHAEYLKPSKVIREANLAAISKLEALIARGQAEGAFRDGINATELHWQISALSVFNVSNKPTFSALFGNELYTGKGQNSLRDRVVAMILADVQKEKTHD